MKNCKQCQSENKDSIEFLINADLEAELHPGEDESLGVHSGDVLTEMLKEAMREDGYSDRSTLDFIHSNGDTDTRFEKEYESVWKRLESFPCFHVIGNHEGAYFDKDGNKWKDYFGYEETYYAWKYSLCDETVTFIALDTWCSDEGNGTLKINEGSGNQVFREQEKEWLKVILDRSPGLVIVFAHAHMWIPNTRSQDNEDIDELVDILKGTYEKDVLHKRANVFINGGHHDYPSCNKVDGVYFIDPIGAIHKGYARVVIDPANKSMDYIGRFNEKSYKGLELI